MDIDLHVATLMAGNTALVTTVVVDKDVPTLVTTDQGPKLRLPGRQCDQKFSSGDQNFIAGRQLATCKTGCYCRLSCLEKMIKN